MVSDPITPAGRELAGWDIANSDEEQAELIEAIVAIERQAAALMRPVRTDKDQILAEPSGHLRARLLHYAEMLEGSGWAIVPAEAVPESRLSPDRRPSFDDLVTAMIDAANEGLGRDGCPFCAGMSSHDQKCIAKRVSGWPAASYLRHP